MADGTFKNLKDLRVEDNIKGYLSPQIDINPNSTISKRPVDEIQLVETSLKVSNINYLKTIKDNIVKINNSYFFIGSLVLSEDKNGWCFNSIKFFDNDNVFLRKKDQKFTTENIIEFNEPENFDEYSVIVIKTHNPGMVIINNYICYPNVQAKECNEIASSNTLYCYKNYIIHKELTNIYEDS